MPVACGSFFVVPVSQKGFGAGSSRPSNKKKQEPSQQKGNGILPTSSPSDEKKQKKAVVLREGSQELHGVLKSVEKDHAKGRNSKLNIDNDIAAKGKVDFVKVESWGDASSSQGDLDNLKVKAFSPAFTSTDMNAPFYERLVYHLQLLESKGDISVVQAQSLPQFENWAFGENRYLQYLIDQHAVFDALRFSISSLQNSISTDADLSCEDATKKAAMAVGLFNEALGLDRCEALRNDIKSLSMAMSAGSTKDLELPKPTTQTVAYVKYINQLARAACNENDGKQACLSILAHIFTVYVTHLTTGMRIGAKALDCLPVLKQAKGVNFYRDYPEHVKDPLKIFIASINKITDFISSKEDQEQVMEELPKAMQKTSLLLVTLAVQERQT